MKKILGLYISRQAPAYWGITDAEYAKVNKALDEEYEAAKSRQKNPDGAPSQYMRGIAFAKAALNTVQPHIMGVL